MTYNFYVKITCDENTETRAIVWQTTINDKPMIVKGGTRDILKSEFTKKLQSALPQFIKTLSNEPTL